MRAKVEVFLKPGVLDVQGKAIEGALHGLGFEQVFGVRVGKTISFELGGDELGGDDPAQTQAEARARAEAEVRAMCDRLLANTVIEGYRVEVA